MRKALLTAAVLFGALIFVSAKTQQESVASDVVRTHPADSSITERFSIYYRFDKTDIDTTYLENSRQIAHIRNYLKNSPRIDSITIHAWASPEGAYNRNRWLSEKRAEAARDFLLSLAEADSADLDAGRIVMSPPAENWDGLIELVETNYHRHDREKVLRTMRDDSVGPETRKWRLQQLDGGYTWDYLRRHYMPKLRAATWVCVWVEVETPVVEPIIEPVPEPEPVIEPEPIPIAEEPEPAPAPAAPEEPAVSPTLLALRTNAMVPLLNFGVEVPVGTRWSVAADYYYPWIWPSPKNKHCFELLGWSVEGRYWFGRNRTAADVLKGHSVGLYGAGGYYDFERNYKGQQGEFVSTGLDYTYAMPVGRAKRVNLEFTLAVGYIHAWARNYNVHDEYGPLFREDGDVLFDYFGPTKAAVSIVVPIYRKEGRK